MAGLLMAAVWGAVGVASLGFFMLPTIVARRRQHPAAARIATLNLLLGVTCVGWVYVLGMAFSTPRER